MMRTVTTGDFDLEGVTAPNAISTVVRRIVFFQIAKDLGFAIFRGATCAYFEDFVGVITMNNQLAVIIYRVAE